MPKHYGLNLNIDIQVNTVLPCNSLNKEYIFYIIIIIREAKLCTPFYENCADQGL